MAVFSEERWNEDFKKVISQFEIESLLPEQEDAIRAFFDGHVFVNLPTGFGKSLIFQCLPIVADVLNLKPRGSSLIVVISPLKSLMTDQVSYLNNIGVPSIAIGDVDDPDIIQQVMDGNYIVVFGSPECFLSTPTWRGIFGYPEFKEKLIGVAIDEAHCITQWGLSGAKKVQFRKWYGWLGEITSLIPQSSNIMILTATATNDTKQQILHVLHLCLKDLKMIEQSPDRPNLSYIKCYMDKNDPLEKQFGNLISELVEMNTNTPRTIIYCQTRKQCSVLFRMFEVYLGKNFYHDAIKPQNRLVEMFHAGTPKEVKEHICKHMSDEFSHLRVLISTVAFGMGVNCKKVRRVIHFGPSKTVEMYVQECGRAGRDGLQSTCVLLHNGLLSVHTDTDMKKYLQAEECSRVWLMRHFGHSVEQSETVTKCKCCCLCHSTCDCGNCKMLWYPHVDKEECIPVFPSNTSKKHSLCSRVVTTAERNNLEVKLKQFQQEMFASYDTKKMVSCPNVLMEFNLFHIKQVLENCTLIFTVDDVFNNVEIWRPQYAYSILRIVNEVFDDILDVDMSDIEETDQDYSYVSDWSQIRDDSSLQQLMDSQDLAECSTFVDTLMETDDENTDDN